MEFDSNIEKYDIHNVAYNPISQTMSTFPVSKINVNGTEYISISLHKWQNSDGPNKGNYIAFVTLYEASSSSTQTKQDALDKINLLKQIFSEYHYTLFESIEKGDVSTIPLHFVYFRWSVNVWRLVTKPRSKWTFADDKPSKDSPCNIKRLLHS